MSLPRCHAPRVNALFQSTDDECPTETTGTEWRITKRLHANAIASRGGCVQTEVFPAQSVPLPFSRSSSGRACGYIGIVNTRLRLLPPNQDLDCSKSICSPCKFELPPDPNPTAASPKERLCCAEVLPAMMDCACSHDGVSRSGLSSRNSLRLRWGLGNRSQSQRRFEKSVHHADVVVHSRRLQGLLLPPFRHPRFEHYGFYGADL